jgi:hypothetical protein
MFQKMKLFELYKILLPPGGSGKSYFCAFIFVDVIAMMLFGFRVRLLLILVSFLVLVDNI